MKKEYDDLQRRDDKMVKRFRELIYSKPDLL